MRLDGGLKGVAVSEEETYVHIADRYHWPKEWVEEMDADFVENIIAKMRAEQIVGARPKRETS